MRLFLALFAILCFTTCSAQTPNESSLKIEKVVLDSTDATFGYYMSVAPKTEAVKGILVLLPGFGQSSEAVFMDTKFHEVAHERGLLAVSFAGKMRFACDSLIQAKLSAVLEDAMQKYPVDKSNVAIGGFSAGGVIALRYAELCHESPDDFPVLPEAVFMADSPVDIFKTWEVTQELRRDSLSQAAVGEGEWIERVFNHYYHGTPDTQPAIFKEMNPFSMDKSKGENERFLKDVAVRAYHDVDIPWRLINRNQTARHANFTVTSELINRLMLLGNMRAEFIQTYQTGIRSNGDRHPHSWSIIDEEDCVNWVLESMDYTPAPSTSVANVSNIQPLLLDKSVMSGMNLRRGRNPNQPERRLFFNNLFRGTELNVQIVSSETASATIESYEIDEFVFLLNGAAKLDPQNKASRTYLKGDFFYVPTGFAGDWKTIGAPNFHNEISVTTITRNKSEIDQSKTTPLQFDPAKLAGIDTQYEMNVTSEMLYDGHEMAVYLKTETPINRSINEPMREQVICILDGELMLTDQAGTMHKFTAGDWLVLPEGFTGSWRGDGHDRLRWLAIEQNF